MRAGERHRVYTDEGVLGGGGPLEPIQHSGPESSTAYREQSSDWISSSVAQMLQANSRTFCGYQLSNSFAPTFFFVFADKLFKLLKAPVFLGPLEISFLAFESPRQR